VRHVDSESGLAALVASFVASFVAAHVSAYVAAHVFVPGVGCMHLSLEKSEPARSVERVEAQAVPSTAVPWGQLASSPEPHTPTRLLRLPAPVESRLARIAWMVIAVALAGLYLAALLQYWSPAHPGVDQNGYLVGGRMFAETLSTGLKPLNPYAFIGRMWVFEPGTEINYPKYPLGLPILFALCIWVFGETGGLVASHLVSPVSAALALLGVFAIVRRLSGGFIALMAMLLLGLGQVFFTLALNPNSHAAGTCAVIWGVFFLLRWLESGTLWRGMVAGFVLGFAYLIRYTDGLMLLPLGVAMLYAARWGWPTMWRSVITLGATTLVCGSVGLMAAFSGSKLVASHAWLSPLGTDHGKPLVVGLVALTLAMVVGLFVQTRSFWRLALVGFAWLVPVAYQTLFNMVELHAFTSYAGTNESTGFQWSFFRANWELMVRVMNDQGLFFLAPIGLLGLALMFRRLPLVATILALWFFPSVLLYTAYYWAPDTQGLSYSRFILTQLPALIVAAAWLLGVLMERRVERSAVAVGVGLVVFVSCGVGMYRSTQGTEWGQRLNPRASLEVMSRQNVHLAALGDELRRRVGPPSQDAQVIVFADSERLHHLQWLGRWQLFSADAFNAERASRLLHRQSSDVNDPDPVDPSRVEFLRALYKDQDQKALSALQNDMVAEALAKGQRVFYVLSEASTRGFTRQIDRSRLDVKPLAQFKEVPPPRDDEDLLPPEERPKQPVTFGRRGPVLNTAAGRDTFRIGEVILKSK
jgi:Dolichyl-phosphate-mannose-protein mannosyltransferase